MNDDSGLPRTPEEAKQFMDSLTFEEPPTREEAEALLAQLPPLGAEVMVSRSLRLPLDIDQAAEAAAAAAGIGKTTWMRQAIETALALQADDQPISRADAVKALTLLRPVRRVA